MDSTVRRASSPEVVPEPGWAPIDPLRLEGGRGSFVSGEPEGDRLRVRYFWRGGDRPLVGRAWFGPGAEGPPGHAHGGSMAAVLDEAMGAVAWAAGHRVVAVQLDTSFRRMLPLGTDALLEAWVSGAEGRKVRTGGRLLDDQGGVFAEATAIFLELDPETLGQLLEKVSRGVARPALTPPPRDGSVFAMSDDERAIRDGMTVLTTERLSLREFSVDDAGFMLHLLNEPSFLQYIGDKQVRTLEDARTYLLDGALASYAKFGFGAWLVEDRESGAPMGMCGLLKREILEDFDIGYAFLPEFWSRGYAREAASGVLSYARDTLGLERVVAITQVGNESSIRLLKKIGFAFEGLIRLSAGDPEINLFALEF